MVQNSTLGDEAITTTILNERTFGWDTSLPATWAVNGFFLLTVGQLYQNIGTQATPVWNLILSTGEEALIFVLG